MKKGFKFLFVIVTLFVVTVGLNAYAEVDGYGSMNIYYPIHKTDEAGKALSGVQFTFSNVKGDYTLKSNELDDGDYLIEYYNNVPEEFYREDIEERKEETTNKWEDVVKFIPTKYQEKFAAIDTWDDVEEFIDELIDDGYFGYVDDGYNYAYFGMYVPSYIDETVAPSGYDKAKVVVWSYLSVSIYGGNRGSVEGDGYLYSSTLYEGDDTFAGYIKYDSSVDYEKAFESINKEYNDDCWDDYCPDSLVKLLKGIGFSNDVADCSEAKEYYDDQPINPPINLLDAQSPSEMLARFDDETTNYACILQIKDSKTIVNPETYGTLAVILLLAFGSIGLAVARKVKTN